MTQDKKKAEISQTKGHLKLISFAIKLIYHVYITFSSSEGEA